MGNITLQNVTVPSQVEWSTTTGGPVGEDSLRIEVYSGNLVVQFSGGDTTNRETFLTYLPLNNNNRIRTYGKSGPIPTINSAILVSPIGMQAHEDEEFLCSVDDWALELTPQGFPEIGGTPYCLILSFKLAAMNGVVIRVGYHVTVTTLRTVQIGHLDLDVSDAPH